MQAKFDLAGIDLEAMKNASISEDGLHVDVGEGGGIDVPKEQLARAYAWEGTMVVQIPGGGILVWNEQSASFEVKEYPTCKPADFQKCPIPLEEAQLHGMFVQSTLTEDLFDPTQLKIITRYFKYFDANGITMLLPDTTTAPNYTEPTTRPFVRDYATGIVVDNDGQAYFEVQVPQYVEGVEAANWPVMTGLRPLKKGFAGSWPVVADMFVNDMNIVAWRIDGFSAEMATRFVNPATGESFTLDEVQKIFTEMSKGDFSNTNGLVLLFYVAKADGSTFK